MDSIQNDKEYTEIEVEHVNTAPVACCTICSIIFLGILITLIFYLKNI